ncbi:MAG: hypothetical protein ACFN0X_07770 [Mitsuokella sp.]
MSFVMHKNKCCNSPHTARGRTTTFIIEPNFLDTVRDENGMVSAEDAARYDKMEADVVNLGKEIDRLERQQQLDAQLAQPTSSLITEQPGAGNQAPDAHAASQLPQVESGRNA